MLQVGTQQEKENKVQVNFKNNLFSYQNWYKIYNLFIDTGVLQFIYLSRESDHQAGSLGNGGMSWTLITTPELHKLPTLRNRRPVLSSGTNQGSD